MFFEKELNFACQYPEKYDFFRQTRKRFIVQHIEIQLSLVKELKRGLDIKFFFASYLSDFSQVLLRVFRYCPIQFISGFRQPSVLI